MHGQIENIVPSVACKMGGGCTEIQKQALTTITQQFLKGRSYQSDHQSDHRRRQKVQI